MCSVLSLRFQWTTHAQIKHAVTNAVTRVRAPMEARALSYATTPNTSSTALVPRNTMVSFVRTVDLHLVRSNLKRTEGASLVCIFCLIQRASHCMKSFAITRLKTDSFGIWASVSAWLTTTSLQTSHFIRTTLSIRIPLPGISFAYRNPGWTSLLATPRMCAPHVTLTLMDLITLIT